MSVGEGIAAAHPLDGGIAAILFSFQGRLRRGPYFLAFLGIFLVLVLLGVVLGYALSAAVHPNALLIAVLSSDLAALLGAIWALFAVQIKRLHDCDLTGWLVLLSLVPGIGWIWTFVMFLLPGSKDENRYGPALMSSTPSRPDASKMMVSSGPSMEPDTAERDKGQKEMSDAFWDEAAELPFRFRGRLNRKPFWFAAFGFPASLMVLFCIAGYMAQHAREHSWISDFRSLVFVFACGFLCWSSLAYVVKRLHDRNLSGWYILLGFVPVIGWIWLLVQSLLPGTPGENRFGSDPFDEIAPANSILAVVAGIWSFVILIAICAVIGATIFSLDSNWFGAFSSKFVNAWHHLLAQ